MPKLMAIYASIIGALFISTTISNTVYGAYHKDVLEVSCANRHPKYRDTCYKDFIFEGVRYTNETVYDVVRIGENFMRRGKAGTDIWIMDFDGKVKEIALSTRAYGVAGARLTIMSPWDATTNRPPPLELPIGTFRKHSRVYAITLYEFKPFASIALFLIALAFLLLSRFGRKFEKRAETTTLSFDIGTDILTLIGFAIFLQWATNHGQQHQHFLDAYREYITYLDTRRLPSGDYLPMDRGPKYATLYPSSAFMYSFVLAHSVILAFLILRGRSLIAGCYYVFVPHPAAKHVKPKPIDEKALADTLENLNAPGTQIGMESHTFKAEKLAKDLRAKAKMNRADADVADAATEYERTRRRLKDAEKHAKKVHGETED